MAKDFRSKTLKKICLSEDDLETISQAVANAEKNTNGEIAIAITEASHNYSFWELLFAVIKSAIVTILLLIFSPFLLQWGETLFWGEIPAWLKVGFIPGLSFLTLSLAFLCANIPFVDRIIIPKGYQDMAVYRRAMRHFIESGVYDTKENSGILIFVSLLEKQVRIIADRGICEKVDQSKWNDIASKLAKGFSPKSGIATKQALLDAVSECSSLLQINFPPLKENPNELRDTVDILEGGE